MSEQNDTEQLLEMLRPIWKELFGGALYVYHSEDTPTSDSYTATYEVVPGIWLMGRISDRAQRAPANAVLHGWSLTLQSALTIEMRTTRLVEQLVAAWNRLGLMHKAALLMRSPLDAEQICLELVTMAAETIELEIAFVAFGRDGYVRFNWTAPGITNFQEASVLHALIRSPGLLRCDSPEQCNKMIPGVHFQSFIGRQLLTDASRPVYMGMAALKEPHDYNAGDIQIFESLVEQITTVIEIDRLHEQQVDSESIRRDMELASEVQSGMLPLTLPHPDGYDIAAMLKPASKVGGDLYDVYSSNGSVSVMVCDVSGKGFPAALLSFEVRAAIRSQFHSANHPGVILRNANQSLYEDLVRVNRFVTVTLLSIRSDGSSVVYANAGHPSALHFRASDQGIRHLESTTFPLGIFANISAAVQPIDMEPGDVLVLYSDGLTEVEDHKARLLGLGGVGQVLLTLHNISAEGILERMQVVHAQHQGEFVESDDMTIVVIKRQSDTIKEPKRYLHWRIEGESAQLSTISETLRHFVNSLNIPLNVVWFEEVHLALIEAVSNIMKHSLDPGSGYISGMYAIYDQTFEVVLVDNGKPFEWDSAPMAIDTEAPAEHGYGMHIIRDVMDSIQYQRLPGRFNHWRMVRHLPQ
ncbi:MAG: SpoIIE family protein phosphatase [Anaerolineae bacterium]|nr:SpoIIE family protein phosphatase [Chloroflexota bacterium]MBP6298437.1 SpoIIE family protein phosphatase [Anaerolineae bacterium]